MCAITFIKSFNALICTKLMTVPAITQRNAVKNFTQIGQKIWKVRMEINLDSQVKCDYHQDDFQETCARSTIVSKKLLYQFHENIKNRFCQYF
jgi:hypothetical protein